MCDHYAYFISIHIKIIFPIYFEYKDIKDSLSRCLLAPARAIKMLTVLTKFRFSILAVSAAEIFVMQYSSFMILYDRIVTIRSLSH